MAVAEMWETLKQAIVAYTGLSPPAFFTARARGGAAPAARAARGGLRGGAPAVQRLVIPVNMLMICLNGELKRNALLEMPGSRMFYGPGGPYALFAGKDASRALAKMSFEPQDLTSDISGLGPFELDALQDWEYKFMGKYVKVGTIKKTAPAEDGNTNTSPETTENAAAAEPDKAPATEVKPREVSSEEVKEKEEVAAAAAPAPDEVAKES
uniref:Cytochrome b5 heme-binding domain-containing protein n=1 Tax=Oryza brachyantha TaxID=4533 RepID=J3N3V8_ORYBR